MKGTSLLPFEGEACQHRVVLASAGTGKTHDLTTRLIRLLCTGVDPKSILATTFTRKAAGEILDRVLGRVIAAAESEGARKRLAEEILDDGVSRAQFRGLAVRLARSMSELSIPTIDALLLRLVSSFSLELGLPPAWSIADEQAEAAMHREAVLRVMRGIDPGKAGALLDALHEKRNSSRVHEKLQRLIEEGYGLFRGTLTRPDAWHAVRPAPGLLDGAALRDRIECIRELAASGPNAGAPGSQWNNALLTSVELCAQGEWEEMLTKGFPAKLLKGETKFGKRDIPAEIAGAFGPLISHASGVLIAELESKNAAAREVLELFDGELAALRGELAAYSFDDLPRLLSGLALTSEETREELRFRLESRFEHALLDEFQDTSVEQFAVLAPILEEIIGDSSLDRSTLFVGDVKQSLYGWRNAEPELLASLDQIWPLAVEHKARSYRSSPVILDAVNRVFADVASNPGTGNTAAAVKWQESFRPHTSARKGMPGSVRVLAIPADSGAYDAEHIAAAGASLAAERAGALLEAAPGASIGILVRRLGMVARIMRALRSRSIEASEEGGNPVSSSPVVSAALSLLGLIEHPGDRAALYHVATCPIGAAVGLTRWRDGGVRETVRSLHGEILDDGLGAFLERVRLACVPMMLDAEDARFRQLVELADGFEREGPRPLDEFIGIAMTRHVESQTRDAVRVMTIHRAKGLEFDAVILPELSRSWTNPRDAFSAGRSGPLRRVDAVSFRGNSLLRQLSPTLRGMHEETHARFVREELSCLYVAMTRARSCLEMFVPDPGHTRIGSSAAAVIAAAFPISGAPAGAGVLWSSEAENGDAADAWVVAVKAPGAARAAAAARQPERVRFGAPSGGHVPLPPHRAPSRSPAAAGERRIDLGNLLAESGADRRTEGSILHAFFAEVGWSDAGEGVPSDGELCRAAIAAGFARADVEGAIPEFRRAMSSEFGGIFQRSRYASRRGHDRVELRREWALAALRESGRGRELVSGKIDRLVVGVTDVAGGAPRAVWAEVIDFKTDRVDREGVREAADRHGAQLMLYRGAVSAALRLDPGRIDCAVAFSHAGMICGIGAGDGGEERRSRLPQP